MNKRVIHLTLAAALITLLAGCATTPPTAYYSLYAPAHRPVQGTATPDSVLPVSVGPVTIPDILKQTQIATGGADGRYRLAEYQRWSGELDRDFARAVAEQLAGNLGTEQVALFPWDQSLTPKCRVQFDVLSMGGDPGKDATMDVRWSLIDPHGKRPPIVRRSTLKETPAEAGYAAWVAAQQRNIVKLGGEIATQLKSLPQ
jgi:uncharacterized lipoprotein YmbA